MRNIPGWNTKKIYWAVAYLLFHPNITIGSTPTLSKKLPIKKQIKRTPEISPSYKIITPNPRFHNTYKKTKQNKTSTKHLKSQEQNETLALKERHFSIPPKKLATTQIIQQLMKKSKRFGRPTPPPLAFDLPITYNSQVKKWIHFFQTKGRSRFRLWLQRADRYFPTIKEKLRKHSMPQDLAYLAMIESGLSPVAKSHANAVGPWQFIRSTANRFGLRTRWWLDERRSMEKSTLAAISYLKILHKEFKSWYLVFASYNMGENGVRRRIRRYKTTNYWTLVKKRAIPKETQEYVPKLIATMLIAKAPGLYGFRNITPFNRLSFEEIHIPGGTDMNSLADHLGISRKYLKHLNAELIKGFIPKKIKTYKIKIPKGAQKMVIRYINNRKKQIY